MSFMDEFLKADEAKDGEFSLIPEGEYNAQVTDVKIDMTKDPSRLSVTMEITAGEHKSRKLWANYRLQGSGLGFLKKDLKTLGIDYSNVKKEEDLVSIIWDSSPIHVKVNVVHKMVGEKTFTNAYINERISADASDIPF